MQEVQLIRQATSHISSPALPRRTQLKPVMWLLCHVAVPNWLSRLVTLDTELSQ